MEKINYLLWINCWLIEKTTCYLDENTFVNDSWCLLTIPSKWFNVKSYDNSSADSINEHTHTLPIYRCLEYAFVLYIRMLTRLDAIRHWTHAHHRITAALLFSLLYNVCCCFPTDYSCALSTTTCTNNNVRCTHSLSTAPASRGHIMFVILH